ncbi:substrate-binding periplasmic protein [Bdellovibrio bacteriovorus]|uniref:substrate-binding periplasmic protein n=1 Tax=Bdellovibrio TaxID=958 RepID=UPI0035A95C4D
MKFLISLTIFLFASSHAFAEKSKDEFQIMTAVFPPFSYVDAQGKPVGLMTEIVEELLVELKKQGKAEMARATIQVFPWKRAYKISTEHPNILMYPLGTVPAEREKLFTWVGPKMTRSIWIYALKEKAPQLQLKSKEELKGKVVGVTRGYSWTEDLQKLGAVMDGAVDDKILVLKLLGRRMPYMAIDEDVLDYIQREVSKEHPAYAKVKFEKIVRLSDLGYRTFGVSKTSDPEIVESLQKAFQGVEKRGVIKKLQKKYPYLEFTKTGHSF